MFTMITPTYHYYAFDAAQLLETCIQHLQEVVELGTRGSHSVLYEVKEALLRTESMLQKYCMQLLQEDNANTVENEALLSEQSTPARGGKMPSLSDCVKLLRNRMEARKKRELEEDEEHSSSPRHCRFSKSPAKHIHTPATVGAQRHYFSSSQNVTDTLLFRLIVALQLCLVRIDDAHFVFANCRRQCNDVHHAEKTHQKRQRRKWMINAGYCGGVLGVTVFLLRKDNDDGNRRLEAKDAIGTLAKVSAAFFVQRMMIRAWKKLLMTNKLDKTKEEIEEWQQQWTIVQGDGRNRTDSSTSLIKLQSKGQGEVSREERLIDYARQKQPNQKSSYFITDGEIRFLIVRKAMQTYYSLTGADNDNENSPQALPCYFRDLIQKSWSIVSKPALKNFSLRASRLLKGASVADRIEIAGVPCYIIAKHPCPELAAAIQRFHRRDCRRLTLQLSTIDESQETAPSSMDTIPKKLFVKRNDGYRQQDIILHCTGGGWFAHMIAFDLLYLLDWSACTGAVVIIPEYDLLPKSPFPAALQQITNVYTTLVSGDAVSTLGFEVNNIVVTGESTGGNLASALCVNLCMDGDNPTKTSTTESTVKEASSESVFDSNDENLCSESISGSEDQAESTPSTGVRLPDAIMLSCAVLNLSLELSHSRVLGTEDPVLPSGVMSAISDAYIPFSLGISKKHPLASPLYAPDNILALFPPTLMFASSNDPLLDDSVVFNQRLRSLGVTSQLRACKNLPHAGLWGLATAGFPEAIQVQKECQEWLSQQMMGGSSDSNQSK